MTPGTAFAIASTKAVDCMMDVMAVALRELREIEMNMVFATLFSVMTISSVLSPKARAAIPLLIEFMLA